MSDTSVPSTSADSASPSANDSPLSDRIAEHPRPAVVWTLGVLVLLALEVGALLTTLLKLPLAIISILPGDLGVGALRTIIQVTTKIPTLLNREVIPNQGYMSPTGEAWIGTFMGLEPKYAWLLRVLLIYAYAFAWVGWTGLGYRWFRAYYRQAAWTPRDDVVDRLSRHRWGQFGFVIVFLFVVMAVFAPALGPTTVQTNIIDPYSYQTTFYDLATDSVRTIPIGQANLQSASKGAGTQNVGPWTYDEFGRFHPFGTLPTGADLFTFVTAGARVSLLIGLASVSIAALIAIVFAMLTAYYKGLADYIVVFMSDGIQALPLLLILILAAAVFADSWIATVYDGALLMIAIFGLFLWPYLWRAVRGPTFQTSEQEWIDAAKSFGQQPSTIMRKHMLPYVLGYLLIYASLTLGGVIISIAALSFLGLGIAPPTPEWGRAVAVGQQYIATASWHISIIPGLMITLVVLGFNALGDGVRDAIDPEANVEKSGELSAAAGGGGG